MVNWQVGQSTLKKAARTGPDCNASASERFTPFESAKVIGGALVPDGKAAIFLPPRKLRTRLLTLMCTPVEGLKIYARNPLDRFFLSGAPPQLIIAGPGHRCNPTAEGELVNIASFLSDVIHQQVLPKRVRRGEIGLAAAKFGNFLHEVDEAVITGKHKSIDQDSGALALGDFFERLGDNQWIEAEGILVNAAVFEGERGRLAVGDHDDLAHIFFLTRENSLRETQTFTGVGVVWTDLHAR